MPNRQESDVKLTNSSASGSCSGWVWRRAPITALFQWLASCERHSAARALRVVDQPRQKLVSPRRAELHNASSLSLLHHHHQQLQDDLQRAT